MQEVEKSLKIKVTKLELDLIKGVFAQIKNYFNVQQINNSTYYLIFVNLKKAEEFDELIKDKLVYQGFDKDYNPSKFGLMCENVIDKMHTILEQNS